MDRANALVHMQLVRGPDQPRGIHWYSKANVAESGELAAILAEYTGFVAINKRYQWLMENFGLEQAANFREVLKPVLQKHILESNPRAFAVYRAMDPMTRHRIHSTVDGKRTRIRFQDVLLQDGFQHFTKIGSLFQSKVFHQPLVSFVNGHKAGIFGQDSRQFTRFCDIGLGIPMNTTGLVRSTDQLHVDERVSAIHLPVCG